MESHPEKGPLFRLSACFTLVSSSGNTYKIDSFGEMPVNEITPDS